MHFVQNNLGVHRLRVKGVDLLDDAAANEIVAEKQDEGIAADKFFAQANPVRDAERRGLWNVGYPRAKPRAVADRVLDLIAGLGRNDDADVGDARLHQVFERVKQHRFVGDGHQTVSRRYR